MSADDLVFVECDSCRAKPGSPQLCNGCLQNRRTIQNARRMRHTLLNLGYTDHGGELWKPPLGQKPDWLDAEERKESILYIPCERHRQNTFVITCSVPAPTLKAICPGCQQERQPSTK